VSYTRPNESPDPVPLLIVGGAVGAHKVVMLENATNSALATAEFTITDHWSDQNAGPPGFYTTTASFDGASGWGGGPNTPQNLNVLPRVGVWRTMVMMVDTDSGRWPTDAPTMAANQTAILGHVTNGINVGGDTRSARQYYEENSQFTPTPARGLTLSVRNNQAFGPVGLPNVWTDYFEQKKDDDGNVIDDRWSSSGGTVQTIVSRALADSVATLADFSNIDALIIVVSSPDATGPAPARFVWPHATTSAREFLCGPNAMTDRRSFNFVFVPLDFAAHDGRQMHSTLSHELGHTLGLLDLYDFPQYSTDITNRLTTDWEMMAGSRDTLPHYTISNKMRMGWIQAGHLKLYNFQGSSAVTQDTTLHAAELGDPPAGRFKAIEIRLGDGWNYYVEYRAEQSAQVTDDLPTDRRVVITDVTSDTFTAPLARPSIVFVRNDIDGDGPLLGNGTDLEEKDPGTQMDLKVEVISTAVDNAVVRVSYGSNGKPEPGIRPWTGGPNWQSPDIEIRNAKASADPAHYFNVPWLGHDNTVVAKVKNAGDLLAKGVVVDFFVTEYSAGDGPWVPLGNSTKDVPPGAVVEFTAEWNPATDSHYCIIVRIRLYQDPGNLAVVDQNIYNNEARSNYTQFVSASASPSTRVGTTVLLANPFDESARVFADVKKTHPQHRVFISHQWLRVAGKGQQPIQVWDEALWGTREWDLLPGDPKTKRTPTALWEMPNRLSVSGWAERPFEADCGALTLTGGVGMRVSAGRATAIRVRAAKRNYVAGQVYYVDTGNGVTNGGTVLIEVRNSAGRYFTLATEIGPDGTFGRDFNNPYGDATKTVEASYLGAYSAAPCSTGPIPA
jgi:M6 family metalloprotease-like protein